VQAAGHAQAATMSLASRLPRGYRCLASRLSPAPSAQFGRQGVRSAHGSAGRPLEKAAMRRREGRGGPGLWCVVCIGQESGRHGKPFLLAGLEAAVTRAEQPSDRSGPLAMRPPLSIFHSGRASRLIAAKAGSIPRITRAGGAASWPISSVDASSSREESSPAAIVRAPGAKPCMQREQLVDKLVEMRGASHASTRWPTAAAAQ